MRVAVTGSTGLIGQALSQRLASEGHEVVPLVRVRERGQKSGSGTSGADSIGSRSAVRWNPETGDIDLAGLEGLHAVVHLAGEPIAARRWSPEQKRRIAESRTRGTRYLAEALANLESPPSVLVSASAIGWYGSRGDELLDESSSPGNGFLAKVCRDWEAATVPASDSGIRVCHPRTGIVLSPSGGALANLLLPFRLGLGGYIGNGKQWMSWIAIDDEVSALVWLLTSDTQGPVNLTAPNPVTNRDFAAALGRALRRAAFLPTPKLALSARLGRELAEALLYSSTRVKPSVLQAGGFKFALPALGPALRSLLHKNA